MRALQKDLRDSHVSEDTTRAIQRIHECLKAGTDTNGWHRVDWRSRGGSTVRPNGGDGRGGDGRGGATMRGHHGHGQSQGQYRGFGSRHNNVSGAGAGSSAGAGSYAANVAIDASGSVTIPEPRIPAIVNRSTPGSYGGRAPPTKYVSRFKASSDTIDEAILNTIILGKLNKFSVINYDEIKAFMCQILDSGETDFLKEFMKLVFQKATTEETFCPLYARLLSELSSTYKLLLGEMVILYKEYMAIFDEVDEDTSVDYDTFVTRTSQKKYRLGYSQFLAELVKHNVLDRDLLMQTIRTIVMQVPKVAANPKLTKAGEEYADCLVRIINALTSSNASDVSAICTILKDEISPQIYPYTIKAPDNKLTMKARFTLLNAYENIQKK